MRYKMGATVYKMNMAAVYATRRPTAAEEKEDKYLSLRRVEKDARARNEKNVNLLVAPFQLA